MSSRFAQEDQAGIEIANSPKKEGEVETTGLKFAEVEGTDDHIPVFKIITEEAQEYDRLSQNSVDLLNQEIIGDAAEAGAMEEETGPKQTSIMDFINGKSAKFNTNSENQVN